MRNRFPAVKAIVSASLLLIVLVSACKKDSCETEICQPCPSSRVIMQYQDNAGRCVPAFHASARVYALHSRTNDTLYTYGFSDSCKVAFLVADSVVYHLESSAFGVSDVISFESWEYQDPISVTECCLCYPLDHMHAKVNGQSVDMTFAAGEYESTPYVRTF